MKKPLDKKVNINHYSLNANSSGGEMVMNGGIYSDQHCPICGERFGDNYKDALTCSGFSQAKHPVQEASRFRVYFKSVSQRFKSYDEASRFLTGLRFKHDEGSYKEKDYKGDLPLSFRKLAEQWLTLQRHEVKPATFSKNKCHINKAIVYWNDKNVENFKKRDFQLFAHSLKNYSSKSKHNYLADIKQFFHWLFDNDDIEKLPKFPKIKFTLARRNTIDKDTQEKIIDEVYRLAEPVNIKIYIGIRFLATYFNCRPGELLQIRERDIDLEQKRILIKHTKEGDPKFIFLLDEDVELLKDFLQGIGDLYQDLYFFRHLKGMKGIPENKRFGKHFFADYWKRACENLKIENIDLYGGTRHSSVQALRKNGLTPEQIKLASGHSTNKAFSRYFELSEDDLRKTYSLTRHQQTGKEPAKGLKSVNG
jgi:integrase